MSKRPRTEAEQFRRESDNDYAIGCGLLLLFILLILLGLLLDQHALGVF